MLAKGAAFAFTAALTCSFAATAQAGSFGIREQSTIGLGEAFAGAAAGQAGLGSMYWNPATMTNYAGTQMEANVAGIFPSAKVTPVLGTSPVLLGLGGIGASGNVIEPAALPSSYFSTQWNDRVWIGMGVNAPFGLLSSYPNNFAGQIYARDSTVRSVDINPSIAYKVNNWLSVGVGFQAMYFKTDLTQAVSPVPFAPNASLEGKDWGFGFTAGATITPMQGTTIGIGYRSSIGLDLTGGLTLGGAVAPLPAGYYPIKASVSLPDMLSVGISQTITPRLTLNGEFEWTNWSRLGRISVTGTAGPTTGLTLTQLPFNYGDGYYLSGGFNYAWSDRLTVRGGVGYEWSPISSTVRDLRVPDSDRVHTTIGLGYQWNERLSFNLAYSHIFSVGNGDVALVPGNPHYITGLPFVGSVDSSADIVSAGLSYKFGQAAAPVRLVTK